MSTDESFMVTYGLQVLLTVIYEEKKCVTYPILNCSRLGTVLNYIMSIEQQNFCETYRQNLHRFNVDPKNLESKSRKNRLDGFPESLLLKICFYTG
jgi:hypothetical protein